jgi:hypothetical protein
MSERRGAGLEGRVEEAPVAHSIVEERLFLLTVRCECGAGPLGQVAQAIAREGERTFDVVTTRCPRCSREERFRFDISGFFGRFYPRRAVSDRTEPSRLLDRVAWVRWARLYLRAFADGPSGAAARPLAAAERIDCGVLALRCLDEALKFFDAAPPGEDGEEAFFSSGSQAAYREAPERFQRVEVLGLKLQAAMMLAAAGVNPDAPDAASGALEPVVKRAVERLGGAATGGPAPKPVAKEPLRLLAPPVAPAPPARLGRRALAAALATLAALGGVAALALAIARALR